MKFAISQELGKKAKVPHEIFLTNLIGNHILWFVAALGMVGTFWYPLALVPIVSLATLLYILWRAQRSKQVDEWYVMCHWQVAARRSRIFLLMLLATLLVATLGWVGYAYLGMMKVMVIALVAGVGILPVMATVLVLIVMESDILHQAAQHRLPGGVVERFPPPEGVERVTEGGA